MTSKELIKELKSKILEDIMNAQDMYQITNDERYNNYITILCKYHCILKEYQLKEGD